MDFTVGGATTLNMGSVLNGFLEFNVTNVNIVDDDIVESDEDFMLSLPDPATVDYTVGNLSTITIDIEDNDCKVFFDVLIISYLLNDTLCCSCYGELSKHGGHCIRDRWSC